MTVHCDNNVSEADPGEKTSDKHEPVDLNNNNDAAGEDKAYFQLRIPILYEKGELSPPHISDNNQYWAFQVHLI